MTNVLDHSLRKCVSGDAIGRTWHSAQNDWRKVWHDDVIGKQYFVVDTAESLARLKVQVFWDPDLVGRNEWCALFVTLNDATKFHSRVHEAAILLAGGVPAAT